MESVEMHSHCVIVVGDLLLEVLLALFEHLLHFVDVLDVRFFAVLHYFGVLNLLLHD